MIAGALGAGLTASIVLAQQIPGSGAGSRGGSGASGASATEPASPYGAASTRGARYLLRNGLDYLQYQQYERALKFLRDAEAREKELGAAERQELKRGIEQAQAGLRAAADSTTPYALSDRSRRPRGFTPARPEAETAIAARTGPARAAPRPPGPPRTAWSGPVARARTRPDRPGAQDAVFGAMASRNTGRRNDEDTPGDPIQLTGAVQSSPAGGALAPGVVAQPAADPQAAQGEIPALAAP